MPFQARATTILHQEWALQKQANLNKQEKYHQY
jgi:hypothetical protein